MKNESLIPLDNLCETIVNCEHETSLIDPIGNSPIPTMDIKNERIDFESYNRDAHLPKLMSEYIRIDSKGIL